MITKAAVIGAGAMGTIMAQILASNGVHVALWGRRREFVDELYASRVNRRYLPGIRLEERVTPTADAAAACRNAELIIAAAPCQHMRAVWRTVGPAVESDVPICSVTKGLEADTQLRPSEILAEQVSGNPIAVLSGPSVAPELARYLPATVVVACADEPVARVAQASLSTTWFRVYTNSDVLGVELGGALKNIIAIAAGILDGLRAGNNAKASLLTRGLVEMTRFCCALGAQPDTLTGLAGIGDLVTTCVSPIGRNRSAGERIGLGVAVEDVIAQSPSVIEGIPTTRAVAAFADRLGIEMPITAGVHAVLFERREPLSVITELMSRPLKSERGGVDRGGSP